MLIVQFGGRPFSTASLTLEQWAWCVFFGAGVLVWGQLITCIPTKRIPKQFSWGSGPPEEIIDATSSLVEDGSSGSLSQDVKRTGQILWIRGLTRLQTQVCLIQLHNSTVSQQLSLKRASIGSPTSPTSLATASANTAIMSAAIGSGGGHNDTGGSGSLAGVNVSAIVAGTVAGGLMHASGANGGTNNNASQTAQQTQLIQQLQQQQQKFLQKPPNAPPPPPPIVPPSLTAKQTNRQEMIKDEFSGAGCSFIDDPNNNNNTNTRQECAGLDANNDNDNNIKVLNLDAKNPNQIGQSLMEQRDCSGSGSASVLVQKTPSPPPTHNITEQLLKQQQQRLHQTGSSILTGTELETNQQQQRLMYDPLLNVSESSIKKKTAKSAGKTTTTTILMSSTSTGIGNESGHVPLSPIPEASSTDNRLLNIDRQRQRQPIDSINNANNANANAINANDANSNDPIDDYENVR